MGKRKGSQVVRPTPFLIWQSPYVHDRHTRLPESLLRNMNFLRLSDSAKLLYIYMRDWAGPAEEVDYAASMAVNLGLMSKNTFAAARNELEEAGFIDYINRHTARDKRETAHYRFSSRWHGLFQQREQCKGQPKRPEVAIKP